MDEENLAVKRYMTPPPAMLEEVAKDPKVLRQFARKATLMQVHKLLEQLRDSTVPLKLRMEAISLLNTISAEKEATAAGGSGSGPGFSVNIVIGSQPAALPKVEVVEQVAEGEK